MYLMDSDILIDLCRRRIAPQQHIYCVGISNCVVSEISLAEMLVGAYKTGKELEFRQVEKIQDVFETVPVTYGIIDRYAQLRALLETRGTRIASMDLFIAATALANNYTLVTHNARHFSRIPGLQLEDWTEEDRND